MASAKNLKIKEDAVKDITGKIKDSESVILFSYQGLTVSDMAELRRKLRDAQSEVKIYKNTLVKRASDDLKLKLDDDLEGPNAIVFGKELLEPIKILSNFKKDHDCIVIRSGIIDGKVVDNSVINEYASIPSREGLLNMLACGMMEHVKNLSIALNMYAEKLEENN